MKSLTYKLACIFLTMSMVTLIVGINGIVELQTAANALNDNKNALQKLRNLLSSVGDSLVENARIQENASAVTTLMADAQEDTFATLTAMESVALPKAFAISQMRYALSEAVSAERGLLLALNMRHIELEELQNTRDRQIGNIGNSLRFLREACDDYEKLIASNSERVAWNSLQEALTAWEDNHAAFMVEVGSLEVLVADLIRGGPLFASSSRKAYDTLFVKGRAAREECEKRIETLNQTIVGSTERSVRQAMEAQTRSRGLVRDLGRESALATERAGLLRDQTVAAKAATADAADKAATSLTETSRHFRWAVVISVAAVLAAVAVGLLFARRISQPVREMAAHLSRVARGDLTADVPRGPQARTDEIGQLARAMQDMIASSRAEIGMANAMASGDYTRPVPLRSEYDQLGKALAVMLQTSNDTLFQVSSAVDRVGRGAFAVSEASRSLSTGAQTSAAALEEIAQTVAEVDAQAQDNADNARQANELATASRDAAQRGYDAVSGLVAAMGEIEQSGRRIASVAKLIDDIAFQTNLLALNATVEAARAGRHGKGFSVVADEVRNLSGRSARAARETSAMVAAMTERMEAGTQLAVRSDSEFREIVEATSKVAQLFHDISEASNAQSTAMAQISQGLNQIDTVVQETTENAARTASSAQTLSLQSEELRKMLARFHLRTDEMQMRALNAVAQDPMRGAQRGRHDTGRMLTGPSAGEQ